MSFTIADVKTLRETTGAGMLDCKKALKESGGNIDDAITFLRKAGIAKAGKKAGRDANEGICVSVTDGNSAALVRLACETDFVAKTDKFLDYANLLAQKTLAMGENGDVTEALAASEAEELTNLIAVIGENMKISTAVRYESTGAVYSYLHAGGKIGVLVDVEGEYTEELLKDLCMHIAAMSPSYVDETTVSAEDEAKEREIAADKAKGKPANIVEKIVEGNIRKWYEEVCLTKQVWFKAEGKETISQVAPKLVVKRFTRVAIGG